MRITGNGSMEFEDFYFRDKDDLPDDVPFHRLSIDERKERAAEMLKKSSGFALFRIDDEGNLGYAINASEKSAAWYGLVNFGAQTLNMMSSSRTAGFLRDGMGNGP